MLDNDGYVSETNATNIFLVKKGRVLTPHADYCLPGITRATIMELVVKEKFELVERRISLSEFHAADEEHGLNKNRNMAFICPTSLKLKEKGCLICWFLVA
ncbi:branched-chain-amino-acid aminotransferase-like protein 2 isoform X1 [Gossypium hirsutum]|uniref:Branched-chain-amino-acid aminotransferase-like protein 2 isoform X1 n=1 Tax=Gossypium hirsutum TaxID=3635 RepID=A0ABM2ZTE3_GOSHI|nr:branched-chain-amino-acid aminotransferase-like protein 2 isoform X1 [Gossypium hirsutum]